MRITVKPAKTTIKEGDVGFGTVGSYGPTHWRFDGKRAGRWVLSQVRHPSQSRPFPDQYVSWDDVERIMANK